MSDDDEDYRALSHADLEDKCAELLLEKEAHMQLAKGYKRLLLRGRDPTASEATTEGARALPLPVASGSGQLVEAPALPDPPVRRSAPGSDVTSNTPVYRGRGGGEREQRGSIRDREPPSQAGMERSAHTGTRTARAHRRELSTRTPTSTRTTYCIHNTARSQANLAGTSGSQAQNAANAGGGSYTGTNAQASALAQARVSASPSPHADNRFHCRDARNSLLREAGAHPSPSMAITPADLDLANRTPTISAPSFRTLFGGDSYHERPQSRDLGILCLNRKSQPYAPRSPGDSGLVFIFPDAVLLEDTCENFPLFLNMDPNLSRTKKNTKLIRYLGTYTKVPIVHAKVEQEEWKSLPVDSQGGAGPPPSTDAIRKWLEQNPKKRQGIGKRDIRDAFRSGKEVGLGH
ncbi:hypothetical protein F5888DRAFT_1636909 [Russula emetica]|nr:hypothetical protein F5888DRAFT_1636909 [Russula emetica]